MDGQVPLIQYVNNAESELLYNLVLAIYSIIIIISTVNLITLDCQVNS